MKQLHWLGPTLEIVRGFPEEVRLEVGYALYLAQQGDKAFFAVPLVGFGSAKVLEVISCEAGDTFRAVYSVKFGSTVYVLHAFQKKSKKGCKTPPKDIRLIKDRLKKAEEHYRLRKDSNKRKKEIRK